MLRHHPINRTHQNTRQPMRLLQKELLLVMSYAVFESRPRRNGKAEMSKSYTDNDKAYWTGFNDYNAGVNAKACPFEYGSMFRTLYIKGYNDARNAE